MPPKQYPDNSTGQSTYYGTVFKAACINLLSFAVIILLPVRLAVNTILQGEGGLLAIPLFFILGIIHFTVSYTITSRYMVSHGIIHGRRIALIGTLLSCVLAYVGTFIGYFVTAATFRRDQDN